MENEQETQRTKANATPRPTFSELPCARLIWNGSYETLGSQRPCRVVLMYVWTLGPRDKSWTATPRYVYEVAPKRDAMGNRIYENAPLNELPAAFFEDVLTAFDQSSVGEDL